MDAPKFGAKQRPLKRVLITAIYAWLYKHDFGADSGEEEPSVISRRCDTRTAS